MEDRFLELVLKDLLDEISPTETAELILFFSKGSHYKVQYELFKTYWSQKDTDQIINDQSFQKVKSKIQKYENTEAEQAQQASTIPLFSLVRLYWVAAILIVTSISYFLYHSHHFVRNIVVIGYKQKVTGRRQKSIITLTDGTQITLNSESTLKYPVQFAGGTREVYLTGEAFFKVYKDRNHPFIIHTDRMNVRVLGTEFNVRSYIGDASTETTLIKGSIEITLNDRPADRILLKPNEKLTVKNNPNTELLKTNLQKPVFSPIKEATQYALTSLTYSNNKGKPEVVETSWLQNRLVAQNESFEELAQKLQRAYGVNIYFIQEDVKKLRFTVSFEKENLVQALDALKLTEPFHYKIIKSNVYIN